MAFRLKFITFFRELFVYHHYSVEFRAKIFAAMLYMKKQIDETDTQNLTDIGNEIYENDKERTIILKNITKEYAQKIKASGNIDALLLEIDKDLKKHPRYAKKIDFAHLRRLFSQDEDEALLQQQVYEFLLSEVKRYL